MPRRWLPVCPLVVADDQTYAVLRLLARAMGVQVIAVTRVRLDAALYDMTRPRTPKPKQTGCPV